MSSELNTHLPIHSLEIFICEIRTVCGSSNFFYYEDKSHIKFLKNSIENYLYASGEEPLGSTPSSGSISHTLPRQASSFDPDVESSLSYITI